jgi:hypothetical protein
MLENSIGLRMKQAIEEIGKESFCFIKKHDISMAQTCIFSRDRNAWFKPLVEHRKVNSYLHSTINETAKKAALITEGQGGELYVGGIDKEELYLFWHLLALVMLPIYFSCGANWLKISADVVEGELSQLSENYVSNPVGLYSDFMKELSQAEGKKQKRALKFLLRDSGFSPAETILFDLIAYLFLKLFPCRFEG